NTNYAVPVFLGRVDNGLCLASNTSVIVCAVQSAIGGNSGIDQCLNLGCLSNIGFDEGCLTTGFLNQANGFFTTFNRYVSNNDLCAFTGEGESCSSTDSRPGAVNERDFSCKCSCHICSSNEFTSYLSVAAVCAAFWRKYG